MANFHIWPTALTWTRAYPVHSCSSVSFRYNLFEIVITYDSLVENFCTLVAYEKLKINLFYLNRSSKLTLLSEVLIFLFSFNVKKKIHAKFQIYTNLHLHKHKTYTLREKNYSKLILCYYT